MKLRFLLLMIVASGVSMSRPQPAVASAPVASLPESPSTFEELRQAIEDELKKSGVPGAGVAVVDTDGSTWVAGVGVADKATGRPATEQTLFRIGSTSKLFVGLAILKLQEEGRLSLETPVREIVPHVAFQNRWEERHPVRVVHLLEHTTGWDDLHLAYNRNASVSLREGLDFHPHSRTSRWIPGTRHSYSNAGAGVAAAVVEAVTGERFEDYVQTHFFDPLGMAETTYFADSRYAERGATLYQSNGKPQAYWHISQRPAGAINASASDMLRLVQFFLRRGMAGDQRLVGEASLLRMEQPKASLAGLAGLQTGCGLFNYSSFHRGYRYQGHSGGVNGGLTEFAYSPELGAGHVVMINNGNQGALRRIQKLLRDFHVRQRAPRAAAPLASETSATVPIDPRITGYYVTLAPRLQLTALLERFLSARRYSIEAGTLRRESFNGGHRKTYEPVSSTQFRSASNSFVELVVVNDPLAGPVVVEDSFTGKRVSRLEFFAPLWLFVGWLVAGIGWVVFAIVWSIRLLRGTLKRGPTIAVRLWPLLAYLAMLLAGVLLASAIGNPFGALARFSPAAVGLMVATIAFALCTVWSAYALFRERRTAMNRWAYWSSAVVTVLHVGVILYLAAYGLIGVRTWA